MLRSFLPMLVGAICFGGDSSFNDQAANDPAPEATAIEGLWSGFWGGWIHGEPAYRPETAELFIQGDYVELLNFPGVKKLTGSVRFDASAGQMHITPLPEAGAKTPKTIVFTYEVMANRLKLTAGNASVTLEKYPVARDPLADARVEFVTATGINGAGDLLVVEYTVFGVGQGKATYFQPEKRCLKTKQGTVLLMQETGWKKVTVDEARQLIREATPVVVAYLHDECPPGNPSDTLRKGMGPARPDSEAVARTFARVLRPGTLVFVLSLRENSLP
jgi:hypothetical protein